MRIDIEIEGITPLLCNKFTDQAQMAASGGSRGSSAAADRGTPLDIAESKLYTDEDGKVGIPQPNLLRCIVDGGAWHKAGRSKITTQKSSLVYACVDVESAFIHIQHKQPWVVDPRPVRIPATGGRILCYRPMFHDWKLAFTVTLDTEIIGANLLRQIIDDAGKRCGLGDYRPACKGPFGKFNVIKWLVEEVKPLKLKKAA